MKKATLLFSWSRYRAIEKPPKHNGDGEPEVHIEFMDDDELGDPAWRLLVHESDYPNALLTLCKAFRDGEIESA